MKPKFIKAYMGVAETFAKLSYATKLKVGAIAVKDDRIISIGYNGTPEGWDNTCEDLHETYDCREVDDTWDYDPVTKKYSKLVTKPETLHAERNVLDKLARGNESGLGAVIFCTTSPCLECAKSIYGAGIKEVFYKHDYRSIDGVNFLKKCGITVTKVE